MNTKKVGVKLTVKTELVVDIDKIAKMAGMSRESVINGYIDDGLKKAKVVLTEDDLKRVEEIRKANIARRNTMKKIVHQMTVETYVKCEKAAAGKKSVEEWLAFLLSQKGREIEGVVK